MAKNKAVKAANGIKHELGDDCIPLNVRDERPAKKAKLLDSSDEESGDEGGVSLKVNEEYARRFEHNKKREEKHKLEEKYGKSKALTNGRNTDDESEEDSEDAESEDDDGELATAALDAEISATLQAIRSKDPRVYDKNTTFFSAIDENNADGASAAEKEKAMTLKDYHTKNLLEGKFGDEDEEDAPPKTYAQEQEEARENLVKEMHAAAESEDDAEDDFLVAKSRPEPTKKERTRITEEDVENAEKDPETFLSNFMSARAWVPTAGSRFKPLESEDEDEDARAEEFENEYNMYFEDPTGANEKLVTYARDTVASTSVRREDPSGRRRARDAARAKREAERREREEDLARLRKLKIEEMEEKVKRIRRTAGLSGRDFKMEEWTDVLEADWSDDQWDKEMRKRFGDAYYNEDEGDLGSDSEDEPSAKGKKKKPKKPKWDDDIDIKDLIPDFDDEENDKPAFTLFSEDEDDAVAGAEEDEEQANEAQERRPSKTSKQKKQEHAEAKRDARRDRRLIESLVDSNLKYDAALASNSKAPTRFRYRETSPTTFGLTPRDILLASDTQLNQFAGLKKLAAFRDPAKKKKDKKHLSKKARLRQWRAETFGDEEGPKGGFEVLLGDDARAERNNDGKDVGEGSVDIREGGGKRKKKRNRKRKAPAIEA
ncbi:Krr1-domain-containing protein [Zopfia rhizophila CBS 207.26]|uniref:Krr1-domain-containing protein n=1 Tax=Zopfia rhizophila CBS 207.26 TaxID=1314779 RepID=A0A6A6DM07_9PEZI|nr:Krr1-domain-containing protein [Zopfia rhizophila CBS 207.26]